MLLTTFTFTGDGETPTEIEVALPRDRFARREEGSLFVLVEALDKLPNPISAELEGAAVEAIQSALDNVRIFAGRVAAEADFIRVKVFSGIKRSMRVFVGWAQEKARDVWDRLSCPGCVLAIRAAVKAGLAAVGVPFLDGETVELAAGTVEKIVNLSALEPIADFLQQLCGERVWDWIWNRIWGSAAGAVDPLVRALKLADDLYRMLCGKLGFCP